MTSNGGRTPQRCRHPAPPVSWRTVRARCAALFGIALLPLTLAAQDLGDITRRIPAQRLRASSGLFDPESTDDARPIPPRATIAVAESSGKEEMYDFVFPPDFLSSVAFWYATKPAPRFWDFPLLVERVNPEIFVETALQVHKRRSGGGATVSQRASRSSNAASGPVRQLMTYVDSRAPGGWVAVQVDVRGPGNCSISICQTLLSCHVP